MCAIKKIVCYNCGATLEFERGYIKHLTSPLARIFQSITGPFTIYRAKPCKKCKGERNDIYDVVI